MGLPQAAINHVIWLIVTHFLTNTDCKIFAKYRQNILLTFKQFTLTIATTITVAVTLSTKLFSMCLKRWRI
jgi:hypothetical protein